LPCALNTLLRGSISWAEERGPEISGDNLTSRKETERGKTRTNLLRREQENGRKKYL